MNPLTNPIDSSLPSISLIILHKVLSFNQLIHLELIIILIALAFLNQSLFLEVIGLVFLRMNLLAKNYLFIASFTIIIIILGLEAFEVGLFVIQLILFNSLI